MRTTRPFLAGLTVLLCSAGTAVAQDEGEAPPQGEEPPAQGNPPPDYGPPPVNAPPSPVPDNTLPPTPAEVRLGGVGQIAISDDLKVFVTRSSQTSNGVNNSSTTYQLQPAIDYFVSPGLALGAQLTLYYLTNDNQHSTAIGLMPRVSYDFTVSSVLSIWPRLGLGYTHYSSGFTGSPDTTGYRVVLDVFVPVVFHPAPHFFIGGGPYVTTDLVAKTESMDVAKLTANGLMSMLGGYFGGM